MNSTRAYQNWWRFKEVRRVLGTFQPTKNSTTSMMATVYFLRMVTKMSREKRDATKVSYMIDNELLKQLNDFCKRTGRSKTKVIEMALVLYLEEHKNDK